MAKKKKKNVSKKVLRFIAKVIHSPVFTGTIVLFLFIAVVITVYAVQTGRSPVSFAWSRPSGGINRSINRTPPTDVIRPQQWLNMYECRKNATNVRERWACIMAERTLPTLTDMTHIVSQEGVSVYNDSFSYGQWGSFTLDIYYPSDATNAPYPAVIFVPGSASSGTYYTWIGNHLASEGYVAFLLTPPSVMQVDPQKSIDGILGTLDYIANILQHQTLSGIVNPEKIGFSGHSLGSMVGMIVAGDSNTITALSILAPGYPEGDGQNAQMSELFRNASLTVELPTQIMVGSLDKIAVPEMSAKHYEQLPNVKELIEINGGNHIGFLDSGLISLVAGLFDNKAEISQEQQQQITKKYLTAWFDYFLKDDMSAENIIFGQEGQSDLQQGVLSKFEFER